MADPIAVDSLIEDIEMRDVDGEAQANKNEDEVVIRLSCGDALGKKGLKIDDANGELTVPVSVARYHLSELVNQLLEREAPVPFDFLISAREPAAGSASASPEEMIMSQKFLTGSLAEFMKLHNIKGEEALRIEYVLALPPPQTSEAEAADDWVCAV